MTEKQIKKLAKKFIKKYKLKGLNLQIILEILQEQGFNIIYYSRSKYHHTYDLLHKLNLYEVAEHTSCFTHAVNDNHLVFILEDLSDEDKISVLLHEEGHIFLEHIYKKGIISNTDIQKEDEANYFKWCVIKELRKIKKQPVLIAACILLVTFISACMLVNSINSQNTTPDTVYITESGDKYHRKGCYYIEGNDVIAITKSEAESLDKEPCKVCKP